MQKHGEEMMYAVDWTLDVFFEEMLSSRQGQKLFENSKSDLMKLTCPNNQSNFKKGSNEIVT